MKNPQELGYAKRAPILWRDYHTFNWCHWVKVPTLEQYDHHYYSRWLRQLLLTDRITKNGPKKQDHQIVNCKTMLKSIICHFFRIYSYLKSVLILFGSFLCLKTYLNVQWKYVEKWPLRRTKTLSNRHNNAQNDSNHWKYYIILLIMGTLRNKFTCM